jgi:hypothetical protein
MVIQGNRPLEESGAGSASPVAGPAASANAPAMPKLPTSPQIKVPQVSIPKPPAAPALAQAKIPTATGNNKLIVFFVILGILAVVLILLVVLIAVKK